MTLRDRFKTATFWLTFLPSAVVYGGITLFFIILYIYEVTVNSTPMHLGDTEFLLIILAADLIVWLIAGLVGIGMTQAPWSTWSGKLRIVPLIVGILVAFILFLPFVWFVAVASDFNVGGAFSG